MISYCGIDCSKCESYLATQANSADLVKALIVAWHGQPYFQVVSVSPCQNWTVEMSTIEYIVENVEICKKAIDTMGGMR